MSYGIGSLLFNSRKGRIVLGILLGVVVVVLVLGFTVCSPMTVVPQGTVVSVAPLHHVQYGFTRPPNSEGATYGHFTADNGVTLFVMTGAQFTSFDSTGSPGSFVYSTGQVGSGTLSNHASYAYIKPPGQYYFVFYNAGSFTSTVTVTLALAVETC